MKKHRLCYCFIAWMGCCSYTAHAVVPITDAVMAETAGKNSIVVQNSRGKKIFLVEEDLAKRETPAYDAIDMLFTLLPRHINRSVSYQNDHYIENLAVSTPNFPWNGSFQLVWDFDQYSGSTFDHSTGSYELNNISGKVIIETSIFRSP